MATTEERLRAEELRLEEAFPGWRVAAVVPAGTDPDRPPGFTVRCARALPAQPAEADEEHVLAFTGNTWEDAFQQAHEGLELGDQGEPDVMG